MMTSDCTMDEVGEDTVTRDGDFYRHLPNGDDGGDGDDDPTSRRLREHNMCNNSDSVLVGDQIIQLATPSQYLPMQDDSNEDQQLPQSFMMPKGDDDDGGDDDPTSRRVRLREQNDDDNNSAGADVDVQNATPFQYPPTNNESNNDYYVPLSSPQLPQSVRKTAINSSHENNDQQPIDITTRIQQQPYYMEMEVEYNEDNDNNTNTKNIDPSFQQHAMELNVALEALESMRRANLAVEFSLATASFPLRHDKCTFCQREALHKFLAANPKKDVGKSGSGSVKNGSSSILKLDGSRLRRFHSSVGSYFYSSKTEPGNDAVEGSKSAATATRSSHAPLASQSNSSLSTMDGGGGVTKSTMGSSSTASTSMLKNVYPPCLTCGHPTCTTHSSSAMSKRSVTICQSCAYLYELGYLVQNIASAAASSNPLAECQQKVNDMIDCYDRAKLLLEYASEYAEEIAAALESNTARSNKIGVGSSASGIVSGITGVIGCGALFFPPVAVAGFPLLIASLVFGTGATTVSMGDASVRQFFSEPVRLADKMFALHGMVLSLLRITDVLRNGLSSSSDGPLLTVSCSRDDMNEFNDEKKEERKSPQSASVGKDAVDTNGVTSSVASTEFSVAGSTKSSSSSVVGRSTRYLGRVCTTASSSISFIPIVGGVLSGASIYFEGKELKRTLAKISEGNPCAKAERIRSIKDQLGMLPDSKTIAAECRSLLEQAHRYDSGREYKSLAR